MATLYVGNLPYSMTEAQLAEQFKNYGASNARIIEGRGFGFVDIENAHLQTAISEKNNTQLDGRTLTVQNIQTLHFTNGDAIV